MKHCNFAFFPSAITVTYTLHDDHAPPVETMEVPTNDFPSKEPPIAIINQSCQPDAATKIQSAYRAYRIQTLYKKISSVNSEADKLRHLIQCQKTVDAIRNDEREKLRVSEALMSLLLRLDSVPGVNPAIREARRKVSRMIVGLQEIVDGLCSEGGSDGWCDGDRFLRDWDLMGNIEEEVCKERGGEEMERFCAEYLGFRCLQRFLREP